MELVLMGAFLIWLLYVILKSCYSLFRLFTYDLRQLDDAVEDLLEEEKDTITVTIHIEIDNDKQDNATSPNYGKDRI